MQYTLNKGIIQRFALYNPVSWSPWFYLVYLRVELYNVKEVHCNIKEENMQLLILTIQWYISVALLVTKISTNKYCTALSI